MAGVTDNGVVVIEPGSGLAAPVRVIAHRGSNETEPEHSLAAYRRAIAEGADAVECDVRLTADGTLVCVHDRRVDRTSNGRGAVSGMPVEHLRRFDFSDGDDGWQQHHRHERDLTRSGVLTMRELLTFVLESSDHVGFAIETKHPTRYGGYVEQALRDLLAEFDLLSRPDRVQVMSFSWLAVRRFTRMFPDLPRVFLVERLFPGLREGQTPDGTDVVGVSLQTLRRTTEYAERIQERGAAMQVWTVDDPADARWCVDLGAEAVISNRPGATRLAIELNAE